MDYNEFIKKKSILQPPTGICESVNLSSDLFDFQRDIVRWALKRGRAAIFAGTGLGKSFMELSFADAVVRKTSGNALILTPLAVGAQMEREAAKFGIEAKRASSQADVSCHISITNYQKIKHFDLSQFTCIVLDESSILKNESGHYRTELIRDCRQIPFRLAATATPAPNDFMELGNHAEFLGIMSYTDMLSTFFVHDGSNTQSWRLKGHAEAAFWRWMASWAVMLQNPADFGYDGSKYILPALIKKQHIVKAEYAPCFESGTLFPMEAQSMSERLTTRRGTIKDRVEKAAEIVNGHDSHVVWCNLNDESAMLADMIPGAVEVRGGDAEEKKEAALDAFSRGDIRVIITKPSICGFGMNWQHCHKTTFVGLNDSFEQIYQAVRRFWRFGQTKEVTANFIASELEGAVVSNIQRKEEQAEHMARQMVAHMADINAENIRGAVRETASYLPQESMKLPTFMRSK